MHQLIGNTMILSSSPASFSARSLSLLRSVGGWMTIAPEQTYVATSIRGLGVCKSTYCKPERRELPVRAPLPSAQLGAVLAVAVAACGLLTGFAGHRFPAEARDMAEPDQLGPGIADCQKSAAPVSPGATADEPRAAALACGSSPAVAASDSTGVDPDGHAGHADFGNVIVRAGAAGRVGFSGG
jgi:hypothetical protein